MSISWQADVAIRSRRCMANRTHGGFTPHAVDPSNRPQRSFPATRSRLLAGNRGWGRFAGQKRRLGADSSPNLASETPPTPVSHHAPAAPGGKSRLGAVYRTKTEIGGGPPMRAVRKGRSLLSSMRSRPAGTLRSSCRRRCEEPPPAISGHGAARKLRVEVHFVGCARNAFEAHLADLREHGVAFTGGVAESLRPSFWDTSVHRNCEWRFVPAPVWKHCPVVRRPEVGGLGFSWRTRIAASTCQPIDMLGVSSNVLYSENKNYFLTSVAMRSILFRHFLRNGPVAQLVRAHA